MLKKKISIGFVIVLFLLVVFYFIPYDKEYIVREIKSANHIVTDMGDVVIRDLDCFDKTFTQHNSRLAKSLNITEEDAFLLGNLTQQWAESLIKTRRVYIKENYDVIFSKISYREKFLHSGFCIVGSRPFNKEKFEKHLKSIRCSNYKVYDFDSEKFYNPSDKKVRSLKNFIVLRKNNLPEYNKITFSKIKSKYEKGNIRIFFADSTVNLKPSQECSSLICKEILDNINNAKTSIDIAIYGYSKVGEIEKAIENAIKRGVKIRLVYDLDSNGKNIYPNTNTITTLISNNMSDKNSIDAKNIMHNKFYIFDDSILISGSANLSHTDMSGFNTNSIVVIESPSIVKMYKNEFEQMYNGKFHKEKQKSANNKFVVSNIPVEVYFSPQDKAITNAILPVIKNAKKYIYIPTFVLTEKRVVDELINAKLRGVEIKIIIDAISASNKHSKHNILRENNINVKTENYAGKIHSKSMIVDDEFTVIGSMNFSNSGENYNDENLILIKDASIAKFYKEFFLSQWNKIDDKWLKTDPKAESIDSIGSCFDGIDNDYDGDIDLKDTACSFSKI